MGATIDQAIANAADAIRDWAEVTIETGGAIPQPRPLEDLRKDPEVVEAFAEGVSLASVPMVRFSGKPAKANLSIDGGILQTIDSEAQRRKLTRSAFVELMRGTRFRNWRGRKLPAPTPPIPHPPPSPPR